MKEKFVYIFLLLLSFMPQSLQNYASKSSEFKNAFAKGHNTKIDRKSCKSIWSSNSKM